MNFSLHPSCPSSLSCLKFSVFQRWGDSRFFGQDKEDEQDKRKYEENALRIRFRIHPVHPLYPVQNSLYFS